LKHIGLILALFFLTGCSCSKEENFIPTQEFIGKIMQAEPNTETVVIPNHEPHRRVLCKNYGPGCIEGTGKRLKIRLVEMIVIQFETEEYAKAEALKLNQWYSKNWLFDEVTGEPVLINFIKEVFNAKPGKIAP